MLVGQHPAHVQPRRLAVGPDPDAPAGEIARRRDARGRVAVDAPWWKPPTATTGSSHTGLPTSTACRKTVMAISRRRSGPPAASARTPVGRLDVDELELQTLRRDLARSQRREVGMVARTIEARRI